MGEEPIFFAPEKYILLRHCFFAYEYSKLGLFKYLYIYYAFSQITKIIQLQYKHKI